MVCAYLISQLFISYFYPKYLYELLDIESNLLLIPECDEKSFVKVVRYNMLPLHSFILLREHTMMFYSYFSLPLTTIASH